MIRRADRVADSIRTELADILRRDMRDPRVGLASISRVRLSGDLSHAVVGVSVLGDDDDARQAAVEALESAKGYLRSQLARRSQLGSATAPSSAAIFDTGQWSIFGSVGLPARSTSSTSPSSEDRRIPPSSDDPASSPSVAGRGDGAPSFRHSSSSFICRRSVGAAHHSSTVIYQSRGELSGNQGHRGRSARHML